MATASEQDRQRAEGFYPNDEKEMIYSNACEYAIRALSHLARREGEFTKLREVAETEEIPYAFLASISQRLVGAGLLASARGPTGGYVLARPAAEVTLYQIKEIVDGVEELVECAVGLGRCSDDVPCPLHDTWKPIRQQIEHYLRSITLADMAAAMDRKRALASGPRSRLPSSSTAIR